MPLHAPLQQQERGGEQQQQQRAGEQQWDRGAERERLPQTPLLRASSWGAPSRGDGVHAAACDDGAATPDTPLSSVKALAQHMQAQSLHDVYSQGPGTSSNLSHPARPVDFSRDPRTQAASMPSQARVTAAGVASAADQGAFGSAAGGASSSRGPSRDAFPAAAPARQAVGSGRPSQEALAATFGRGSDAGCPSAQQATLSQRLVAVAPIEAVLGQQQQHRDGVAREVRHGDGKVERFFAR